jgi:hypothetical protein
MLRLACVCRTRLWTRPGPRPPAAPVPRLVWPWIILIFQAMIDEESRRKDEAFARKLRDWKRRRDGDCRLFFEVFGPDVIERIEQNLAARALVREFFDRRRSRARQTQEPKG